MELARSLNYSINIGAQNLRLKQNRTVGVVVPYDPDTRQQLTDPFFLAMLGSLADALTEQGLDMLLTRVDAGTLDAAAQPFDSGRVIGVILIGQWRHHDQLNQLAPHHDGHAGRKRIAFLGDTNLPEVAQRYQGYCKALAAQGLPADPQLLVPVSFLPGGGEQGVRELQRRGAHFDGLFACSDLLAMAAINTLRAHGRGVPDDVAVVGYDDIELASYFHPPLST
eukprot:gene28742-32457_t